MTYGDRFGVLLHKGPQLLLLALAAVTVFLLGCYEMGDTDIWWHLSGGRWVLEHGRVPGLDPFTYGSADRLWVDVHWGFEVVAALVHRVGGVPGLVLLAATAGCTAIVIALAARRSVWPAAVTTLCWLPALVLVSWRFDPRPEIFSLLYLSIFLAVLWRVDDHPRLIWVLPVIEVLWANTQGLFVLGPIVVVLFLAARGGQFLWDRWHGRALDAHRKRWWRHVGWASLAVGAAVLINPYGMAGARFPFDLFPKVSAEENPYKVYIDELNSPRELVVKAHGKTLANWYIQSLYLLLLAVPASFVVPAAWRAWRAVPSPRRGAKKAAAAHPVRAGAWIAGVAALGGLLVLAALGLPQRNVLAPISWVGTQAPLLLAAAGCIAAALLRRSWRAVVVALGGGVALALWASWLRSYFVDWGGKEPSLVGPALVMSAAATLLLWQGACPFRLLLAGSFGYLALRAQQNDSRFALVAGLVLTWNIGAWAAEVAECVPPGWWARAASWGLWAGVAGLLVGLMLGVVTDRYGRWTGEPRLFSLAEQPFQVAHEAIRFAGRDGLPTHALLYDLGQPGLYDWYHGPERKPFLDGRLEMPALETFQAYVNIETWLQNNDPRWAGALERLGSPLVLLAHSNHRSAEAALLSHSGWRCIYFDAMAAVFVPQAAVSERAFPAVNFAKRHFDPASAPLVADQPGAAFRELWALSSLGTELRRRLGGAPYVPVLLAALGRAEGALGEAGERRDLAWKLLGDAYRALVFDPKAPAATPAAAWDPATAIPLVQATYCYRQAAAEAPEAPAGWQGLYEVFKVRKMDDAMLPVGKRLATLGELGAKEQQRLDKLQHDLSSPDNRLEARPDELPQVIGRLLAEGRPETAVRLVEVAEGRGTIRWTWPLAEQVGVALMHLGRPADARRIWQQCPSPLSAAVRSCRLAATYWVERDFDTAARLLQEARQLDGRLGETAWGLAILEMQRGHAAAALAACKDGLKLELSPRQRLDLVALQELLLSLNKSTPSGK
jgi:hypothetical protein